MTGVLLAFGVFLIGMVTPGPNIMSIIATSMSMGRRQGSALAIGTAVGTLLWASLAALGLTALLAAVAGLMVVIKSLGAAYLLWLALKAFRSAASPKGISGAPPGALGSELAYFRRGLIIQMTNPKAAMVWVATMSLALSEGSSILVLGIVVVGCSLISFAGHLAYALMFSTPRIMARYAKSRRWLECALGTYFCFASYKLATMRV